MRKYDIEKLLLAGENQSVEFKEAKNSFPKDGMKTICSFANTNDGLLILGISENIQNKEFYISGVNNPEKILDDLYSLVNNPKKINRNVINEESIQIINVKGKSIIAIPIHKVDYKDKPIYLNENVTSTYFRQGTGDFRCSQEQINSMLRDSAKESFDSTLIQDFSILDLDTETIKLYREKFDNINAEHPFSKLDNEKFLIKMNALRRDRKDDKIKPTVAGLLIFGTHNSIKEFIPHYNVEYVLKEFSENNRFKDRVIYDGTWGEDNLFNFFYLVIEKLYLTLNDNSNIQENSMNRIGISKLRIAIREAFINSLIHSDYKSEKGAFLHYGMLHALNKRILQYGVTMQAIPSNPARDVVLPRNTQKAKRQKVKHFDNQELKKFLGYLDNLDSHKYRYYYEVTLYKFLLATGCRINEALALSWADIDLDNAIVYITKTLNQDLEINSPKSKSSYRDIDIDQATVSMLKQYKLCQTKEAWKIGQCESVVFSDFIHEYPSSSKLKKRLLTHFKRADVPNIGFHGFRHTHASLRLNSAIPYKELQHRLGHSTLSMTMDTYSHLSKEKAKTAVLFYEKAVNSL